MADNNYVEGNTFADDRLPSNPYAQGGAIVTKLDKIEKCQYYASLSYVVAAGGATVTVTPVTGNLGADLRYYTVEISDGISAATNQLDLNLRTTAFVVDTSLLDTSKEWVLSFFGEDNGIAGIDPGCTLKYNKNLGVIGVVGGSGDTIPSFSKWKNVSMKLLLESSGDALFTAGFPTNGVDIPDGGSINLQDYTTAGSLVNLGSYVFKLQIKKIGVDPVASTPTAAAGDVWTSFANTVTFPYAIPRVYTEILNALTIKTSVAGPFSQVMTILVPGEGTKPSVSFTINTIVAA